MDTVFGVDTVFGLSGLCTYFFIYIFFDLLCGGGRALHDDMRGWLQTAVHHVYIEELQLQYYNKSTISYTHNNVFYSYIHV